MGTAVIVRKPVVGPPVDPHHSVGVAGATHRWVPEYAGYAAGEILATIPDLIGDRHLALSVPTETNITVAKESGTGPLVARIAAAASVTAAALIQNMSFDMPSTGFSFVSVFKVGEASSSIVNVDGFSITRAGNKSYSAGGGAGTSAVTASGQTDGWVVAVVTVAETSAGSGLYTLTMSLNGAADVTSGANVTAGSQRDRVVIGQNNTSARTTARDYAELITWPFVFDATQKAAALAAMRAHWAFVPQA